MASYIQLEPSSFTALGLGNTANFDGSNVSFFATSSFIYTLFFIAIIGAAFYEYILVGVYRMEASENGIRKSNETFKRTTWGLLGVFGLFLIISTVNKGLLTGDVGLGEIRSAPGVVSQSGVGGGGAVTGTVPLPPNPSNSNYAARKASHDQVATRLSASNVKTNYNNVACTEAQFKEARPACTSLAYMPEETIQLILKLKSMCNCNVVVTGGTEPGHITHGENKRAFDLRLGGTRGDVNNADPLYVFIKTIAASKLGSSTNCYEKYILYGFTFCDEKPPNTQHFHVY